jgi:hypothetical protein
MLSEPTFLFLVHTAHHERNGQTCPDPDLLRRLDEFWPAKVCFTDDRSHR